MLFRHIIGYAPSLLVPALASFVAVFLYTRLLSPEQYGHYALAMNSMTLLNAVFFYWLQVSLPRLMPKAIKDDKADQFRMTAYAAYAAVSVVLLALGVLFVALFDLGDFRPVAIAAIPMALSRSILNLNQAFHRSYLNFKRYNVIECGQAIIGLIVGVSLVYCAGMGSLGANLGLIAGMLCMIGVDLKTMLKASWRDFDPQIFKDIAHFGLPLIASYGFSFLIASSDRYFINYFQGASQVGVYAAGYTVVDRIITMLFMLIATPSFPLLVRRLEHEGVAAAQEQMRKNGMAVLFLALPACAGLMLTNKQMAGVLIGPEFREGALHVMPWIVAASVLNGLSTHFFSHAFQMAKNPRLLVMIQAPVVLVTIGMNVVLIPRYGYMGAAYAAVVSYTVMLVLNVWFGSRVFPFAFPYKPVLQILASVGLLAAVLSSFDFPVSVAGLVEMVVLGGLTYAVGIVGLDALEVRSKLLAWARKARLTSS